MTAPGSKKKSFSSSSRAESFPRGGAGAAAAAAAAELASQCPVCMAAVDLPSLKCVELEGFLDLHLSSSVSPVPPSPRKNSKKTLNNQPTWSTVYGLLHGKHLSIYTVNSTAAAGPGRTSSAASIGGGQSLRVNGSVESRSGTGVDLATNASSSSSSSASSSRVSFSTFVNADHSFVKIQLPDGNFRVVHAKPGDSSSDVLAVLEKKLPFVSNWNLFFLEEYNPKAPASNGRRLVDDERILETQAARAAPLHCRLRAPNVAPFVPPSDAANSASVALRNSVESGASDTHASAKNAQTRERMAAKASRPPSLSLLATVHLNECFADLEEHVDAESGTCWRLAPLPAAEDDEDDELYREAELLKLKSKKRSFLQEQHLQRGQQRRRTFLFRADSVASRDRWAAAARRAILRLPALHCVGCEQLVDLSLAREPALAQEVFEIDALDSSAAPKSRFLILAVGHVAIYNRATDLGKRSARILIHLASGETTCSLISSSATSTPSGSSSRGSMSIFVINCRQGRYQFQCTDTARLVQLVNNELAAADSDDDEGDDADLTSAFATRSSLNAGSSQSAPSRQSPGKTRGATFSGPLSNGSVAGHSEQEKREVLAALVKMPPSQRHRHRQAVAISEATHAVLKPTALPGTPPATNVIMVDLSHELTVQASSAAVAAAAAASTDVPVATVSTLERGPSMPHANGLPTPTLHIDDSASFVLNNLSCTLGTHLVAPSAAGTGGASVDQLPLGQLVRLAVLVDASGLAPDEAVQPELLPPPEHIAGRAIIIFTGRSKLWSTSSGEMDYTRSHCTLSRATVSELLRCRVPLVATDAASLDSLANAECPAQRALLAAGTALVLNMCNISGLMEGMLRVMDSTPTPADSKAVLPTVVLHAAPLVTWAPLPASPVRCFCTIGLPSEFLHPSTPFIEAPVRHSSSIRSYSGSSLAASSSPSQSHTSDDRDQKSPQEKGAERKQSLHYMQHKPPAVEAETPVASEAGRRPTAPWPQKAFVEAHNARPVMRNSELDRAVKTVGKGDGDGEPSISAEAAERLAALKKQQEEVMKGPVIQAVTGVVNKNQEEEEDEDESEGAPPPPPPAEEEEEAEETAVSESEDEAPPPPPPPVDYDVDELEKGKEKVNVARAELKLLVEGRGDRPRVSTLVGVKPREGGARPRLESELIMIDPSAVTTDEDLLNEEELKFLDVDPTDLLPNK